MARFVLQLCKFREARVVPQKGVAPEVHDWESLSRDLVPSSSTPNIRKEQLGKLRLVQPGAFVGLMRSLYTGRETTFLLMNSDRTNRFEWLLRNQPDIVSRIRSIFRVDQVDWEQEPPEERRV